MGKIKNFLTKVETKAKVAVPFVPFIALALSIFVTVRNCSQDRDLSDQKYEIDALVHRPLLKLVSEFEIDSVTVDSVTLASPPAESLMSYVPGEPCSDSLVLEGKFTIYCALTMQNMGSDIASVVSQTVLTKKTTDVLIRKYMLSKEEKKVAWLVDSTHYYFRYLDIAPGDSFSFKIPIRLLNVVDPTETVIHLLVLYRNSVGALFDTYCQFRLINRPIPDPQVLLAKADKQITLIVPEEYIEQCFLVTESGCTFHSYNRRENEIVETFLTKLDSK